MIWEIPVGRLGAVGSRFFQASLAYFSFSLAVLQAPPYVSVRFGSVEPGGGVWVASTPSYWARRFGLAGYLCYLILYFFMS